MNDLCINWIEEQNDNLLNVKVNDAYDNYKSYCKANNLPYVVRGTFKHIINCSKKWKLYYNKLVFTNEWEGNNEQTIHD